MRRYRGRKENKDCWANKGTAAGADGVGSGGRGKNKLALKKGFWETKEREFGGEEFAGPIKGGFTWGKTTAKGKKTTRGLF